MANAKLKTQKTNISAIELINSLEDEYQKEDCLKLNKIMEEISGETGKIWGKNLIGFIDTHLKYESGRELDWFKLGFAPRKGKISIYLCDYEYTKHHTDLLEKLGKHKTGVGCLYINKLSDVDEKILSQLIKKNLGA